MKFNRAKGLWTGSIGRQSDSDGGKRNSSPGRARHKPSNHCAGKAGCSPLDLYARVRTSLCHCTRDRGCSAHPVFPAPSFVSRDTSRRINSGRASPASVEVRPGAFFTSPRLPGEVEICAKREFRVRGYRSISWRRACGESPSPQPSPREERGEGEEAAALVAGHAGLSCTFGS